MPSECSVESCPRVAEGRGWCHAHLLRFLRLGDVMADRPIGRRRNHACEAEGCDRQALSNGLCRSHRNRQRKSGDVRANDPIDNVRGGTGYVSHGYRIVPVPRNERHLSNGEHAIGEHRLVMARHLGRAIAGTESIHHVNGDRLDNRIENLELWSRWQPSGQRVSDKIRLCSRTAPALCAGASQSKL